MSDFWKDYEPEPTKPAPVIRDELTEPLGCVVVRPLVANSTTPPAAQQDIQRLSALVRAQQITIDKLEAQRPVAEPHKWVGLTDEELDGIYAANGGTRTRKQIAAAIEAKLKEKNGLHRQHVIDGSPCWCEPETIYTDPETGASVVVHKEPQ